MRWSRRGTRRGPASPPFTQGRNLPHLGGWLQSQFESFMTEARVPRDIHRNFSRTNRQPGRGDGGFGLADGGLAIVKNRGRQHRAGMALPDSLDQMLETAHPAAGDDGNADRSEEHTFELQSH